MAKPRIVSQKNKPRVIREDDYSLMLKWKEPEEEKESPMGDEAARKLRKEALKDITPIEGLEEPVKVGKKGVLQKVKKKLFG